MNTRVEVPGPGEKLQIVSKPIPQPPPRGLIVKNHYSGICHSDVHSWTDVWRYTDEQVLSIKQFVPGFEFPAVIGHEISGEVYALGSEYKGDLAVGDRVAVYPWCGCEDCGTCKSGDQRACARFSEFNIGIGKDGGYQQYTAVDNGRYAFRVKDGVPMDVLALMCCSGLTAFNAIMKLKASVERGTKQSGCARILIIGAGGLGGWAIKWAKVLLPDTTKIFVADITEDKLAGGIQQGADEGILWDRAASDEELIGLTQTKMGGGPDGAIDFVGIPSTSNKAVMSLKMGGTCVIAGLAGGTAKLPLMHITLKDLHISGIVTGSTEQLQEQMDAFVENKIQPPPITHVKPEDIERCLTELKTCAFQGRYVIDWTTQ